MSFEIQNQRDTLIVRVYGEFDLRAADYCRRDIDQKLRTQGARHILFNLGGVTFIDSSGLGVILGRYRKVKENGGKVAISDVPPRISRILELSGITRLIPVYPNESTALKELA
ncbi:MAG: anti-sigma F factor antagonist [Firmicutes bacterium]|nr:anti-sigma F factor antagonist [Bacillota bacterium]